jgi:hypothetical protein
MLQAIQPIGTKLTFVTQAATPVAYQLETLTPSSSPVALSAPVLMNGGGNFLFVGDELLYVKNVSNLGHLFSYNFTTQADHDYGRISSPQSMSVTSTAIYVVEQGSGGPSGPSYRVAKFTR